MQPDPNLGAHILAPPPVCSKCGAPGLHDAPLTVAHDGAAAYCPECAVAEASAILAFKPNRAMRRAMKKARR